MSTILCLGASYGMLIGVKLALAGHKVTFVGRRDEIEALRLSDLIVRIPLRKSTGSVELRSDACAFTVAEEADPDSADLVLLAMQEPQLAHPDIAKLLERVGRSGKPCLSIMNLPPAAFLRRLSLPEEAFANVYTAPDMWDTFDPAKISNTSPDPQALRMDPAKPGELTVTLASNFKAAPFGSDLDQALLTNLARDVSRLKVEHAGRMVAPPVRLLAHSSAYVPLAKWPMLITGNYRCLTQAGPRTIAEAVLSDLEASERIYQSVTQLLHALGVPDAVLVPFGSYAKVAEQLVRPSSIARALHAGATAVERVDRLVLNLLRLKGIDPGPIEKDSAMIDHLIDMNGQAT